MPHVAGLFLSVGRPDDVQAGAQRDVLDRRLVRRAPVHQPPDPQTGPIAADRLKAVERRGEQVRQRGLRNECLLHMAQRGSGRVGLDARR